MFFEFLVDIVILLSLTRCQIVKLYVLPGQVIIMEEVEEEELPARREDRVVMVSFM